MSPMWEWEPEAERGERKRARGGRKRRRRRERQREARVEAAGYDHARNLAEKKVKLTGEVLRFGVLVTLLMVFIWPVGVIVLICGGPSLLRRFYRIAVEPRLRERFVEDEVRKQVRATLTKERRALEGEHSRSMEELSASIAHEIRNPITAAKSLVQQMGEDTAATENVEYAEVALEELSRVERSVSHLLRFARDEDLLMAEMRMADVLDSALETFRDRLSRNGIAIDRQIDCDGVMEGDAEKLRRAIINLVGNSIDALTESGAADPRVEIAMGENLAGSEVWLRIRDNGPGIDPETRAKIFSPFYTSKTNGTGLGLAITRKLVEAHGGTIDLESEPNAGAEFLLTFPKQPGRAEVAPASESAENGGES